jgi:hypothetical protein
MGVFIGSRRTQSKIGFNRVALSFKSFTVTAALDVLLFSAI